jgi:DNA-binding PadR family transcriptional regulator
MGNPSHNKPLTELEGAVLGAVVRDGPCTSYAVKELFRASPSEFWSGSAGSIYPLMKRLEQRGLVASESGSTGRRGHRSYRVTSKGRRAFARWMTDSERTSSMGFDPLRTRLVFAGQLSSSARAEFRAAVEAALEEVPAPSPRDDSHLQRLHRIWSAARRRAFEKVIAGLDEPQR